MHSLPRRDRLVLQILDRMEGKCRSILNKKWAINLSYTLTNLIENDKIIYEIIMKLFGHYLKMFCLQVTKCRRILNK